MKLIPFVHAFPTTDDGILSSVSLCLYDGEQLIRMFDIEGYAATRNWTRPGITTPHQMAKRGNKLAEDLANITRLTGGSEITIEMGDLEDAIFNELANRPSKMETST